MLVGAVAYGVCSLGRWHTTGVTGIKIILLLGAILSGVGVYGGTSHLLGSEEMGSLWEMIQNKIRRKSSINLRGA